MRKIIVLEHITLGGVIQAPGGPDEDAGDGFAYGPWAAPYDDEILGAALKKQMDMPFDLLLGRKTFDIWASHWPQHADVWPGVNTATRLFADGTLPTAFKVTESIVGSNGVIAVNYKRAGAVPTGSL